MTSLTAQWRKCEGVAGDWWRLILVAACRTYCGQRKQYVWQTNDE